MYLKLQTHRITYDGPASVATEAGPTSLADTQGVELTSARRPEPFGGQPDRVRLALTVVDSSDVIAAVRAVGGGLPAGAGLAVEVP